MQRTSSSPGGSGSGSAEPEVPEGTIERITFHSEESRWTVLRLRTEKPAPGQQASVLFDPVVTAVGETPRPSEGLTVRLLGRWTQHKVHGSQFEFESLEMRPPRDDAGLIKYLSSETFSGVGITIATRIVEKLGADTLERIRTEQGALNGIQGCLLYTSPSPRDATLSRMPSSA